MISCYRRLSPLILVSFSPGPHSSSCCCNWIPMERHPSPRRCLNMTHFIDFTRRPSASNRIRLQVTLATTAVSRRHFFFLFLWPPREPVWRRFASSWKKGDEVNVKGPFNWHSSPAFNFAPSLFLQLGPFMIFAPTKMTFTHVTSYWSQYVSALLFQEAKVL